MRCRGWLLLGAHHIGWEVTVAPLVQEELRGRDRGWGTRKRERENDVWPGHLPGDSDRLDDDEIRAPLVAGHGELARWCHRDRRLESDGDAAVQLEGWGRLGRVEF